MSKAWGYIRFYKTNNIYVGCYDGTVDMMYPYFCSLVDCYNANKDCYSPISYCLNKNIIDINKEDIDDIDIIDIYTDYGMGFYWTGTGSEKYKIILDGINPWSNDNFPIDGTPKWVLKFNEEKIS